MEYYTAMRRNKPKLHATMWMNLTNYKAEQKKPGTKDHTVKF